MVNLCIHFLILKSLTNWSRFEFYLILFHFEASFSWTYIIETSIQVSANSKTIYICITTPLVIFPISPLCIKLCYASTQHSSKLIWFNIHCYFLTLSDRKVTILSVFPSPLSSWLSSIRLAQWQYDDPAWRDKML